ncbi:hypothetical protein P152DRAFT_33671 [Eremomyces bilateralis CBS 781.70]|uniref:Uncharacterized protein n=1 Tax=Eremomyces bilateralis CBS 781.70 TaxID=1392243 RepID=A0A6G1G3J0_9PEZI|nr:uncharacterized protein P152DRAFT_33671 [Eremomyces bilateralis CBS 781.70]KAF1812379.1 hypothetical protein P152DRAFT_33671 [Eremomyces bilateralis CBS 781.70]
MYGFVPLGVASSLCYEVFDNASLRIGSLIFLTSRFYPNHTRRKNRLKVMDQTQSPRIRSPDGPDQKPTVAVDKMGLHRRRRGQQAVIKSVEILKKETAYFKDRPLPSTPASIQTTPVELYDLKVPSPLRQEKHENAKSQSQQGATPNLLLVPIKTDPASLSTTLSALPEGKIINFEGSKFSAMRTRRGSVIAVITPEGTWRRSVYIPGPIRLPTLGMKSLYSMSNLDYLDDGIELPGEPWGRRLSEDGMIDDIVSFFESFKFERVGIETESGWARPPFNDADSIYSSTSLGFSDNRKLVKMSQSSTLPIPQTQLQISPLSRTASPYSPSKSLPAQNRRKRPAIHQKSGIRRFLASVTSIV